MRWIQVSTLAFAAGTLLALAPRNAAAQLPDHVVHSVELLAKLAMQLPGGSVVVQDFEAGLALHQFAHRSEKAVDHFCAYAHRSRERRRG